MLSDILLIIWILDICNIKIPMLNWLLNDSNGMNTSFWWLVWIFIILGSISIREE